jgi:hypothetical protein
MGVDADIGAREYGERNTSAREALSQLTDALANGIGLVSAIAAKLVRRGDDRRRAIGGSQLRHRERFVPIARAVINPRQDVTMNVNKRSCHQVSERSTAGGTKCGKKRWAPH